MTLTKADLADLLFEKVGLNKREAKDMVECFFEEVRKALETGEGVEKVVPILAPYKMASVEVKKEPTTVKVRNLKVGPGQVGVMAGPCSVEGKSQILEMAHKPEFKRNGRHRSLALYERHMFWMLCPTCHKLLDRKIRTPAELGLS